MPVSIENTVIRFNDGTTQSTAAGAGGVTSLNGQTGAITNTTFNAIGSYSTGARKNGQAVTTNAGDTAAGSAILVPDNSSAYGGFNSDQNNVGNLGKTGTYRAMSRNRNNDQNCEGVYTCQTNLWVRIS